MRDHIDASIDFSLPSTLQVRIFSISLFPSREAPSERAWATSNGRVRWAYLNTYGLPAGGVDVVWLRCVHFYLLERAALSC